MQRHRNASTLSLPLKALYVFKEIKYLEEEKLARVVREGLELVTLELSFESWEDFTERQGKILGRGNLTKALLE